MADALIGHTGFVGSNLARQRPFDEFYNSKNIEDIRGRSFDTVICAGAPGSKWYANENPGEDRESVTRLTNAIRKIEVKRFVLISTVDVFSEPRGVNEDSQPLAGCFYGNNRLDLEVEVEEAFGDRATIVRLPSLFGPDIKKNALYDLMTGHETEKIAPNAVYQWYPVERLAGDIERVVRRNIPLIHFGSTGISMEAIRQRFFPGVDIGAARSDAPLYDVCSKYAGFWYSKSAILSLMEAFIAQGIQQPR
jgi:nucleoside-diphosphate-sugar epimerase